MRRLVLAAIAILGAAFVVSQAVAAPVNIVAPLDPRGPMATAEQYPDKDYTLLMPKVFQTRFVYGADGATGLWATTYRAVTVDSTIAIRTQGYRQVALLFQFVVDDTVAAALFAFQIRGHSNSGIDTLSTFALPNFNRSSTTANSPDTIGSFTDFRYSQAGTPIVVGGATADTAMLFAGERPMIVVWSKGLVGQNMIVPINTTDGVPFVAPYMSFRLRLMNTYYTPTGTGLMAIGSAGMAYGAANLTGSGICEMCGGHPARSALGRSVTVTADLVGLR